MALDLTDDFTTTVNFDPSDQDDVTPNQAPEYTHSFAINDCVPEFTDEEGFQYPETMAVYGYQLNFESYDDLVAFESNPQFSEIVGTIGQMVSEELNDPEQGTGSISTLQLEILRDDNPFHIENEDAGPDSFTENTLGDIEIVTENVIPIINQTYGLNIQSGVVLKESAMVPNSCIHPPIPEDHTSLEDDSGQKLGGGSTGATDYTM